LEHSFIESLSVRSFRQFQDLKVNFNPRFNVIAGPNGSGKTSILACIAQATTYNSLEYSRASPQSEVFVDINHKSKLFRIGLGSGSFLTTSYRNTRAQTYAKPPSIVGRISLANSVLERELPDFAPLLIGAHRTVSYTQTAGMQRESPIDTLRNEVRSSAVRNIFEPTAGRAKQWLINRYFMIDKDWAQIQQWNWKKFISALPELAPFDSDFRFVRIREDMEPVFSIYGKECYLEELSSGFQAVLTLVTRIVEWIEGVNEGDSAKIDRAVGSVLIDEIDVHLHPEWQFSLRTGLRTLFPNLQFVVTSHSPHVLASAEAGEVIVMPESPHRACELSPTLHSYSGWTTDQILADLMGVRSLENKQYETLVKEAFIQIEASDYPAAALVIAQLKQVVHPDDPIVQILNMRMASQNLKDD
jgi:energy-coupling factor transporter ATP-binding protein EcfA2